MTVNLYEYTKYVNEITECASVNVGGKYTYHRALKERPFVLLSAASPLKPL